MEPSERKIAAFFDAESSSMSDRHQQNGIPHSAEIQVQDIVSSGARSVLDVGSGPGTVLLELLDRGIELGIGVDLSSEMNRLAMQKLEQSGYGDRVKILEGSFLDVEVDQTDAVSLHRVLCCHPDRKGMLDKASQLKPETISLTIPRDWKVLQAIVALYGLVTKLSGGFRPFVHRQKMIDAHLKAVGYLPSNRHKGLIWVTTTYQLQS